MKPAIQIKRVYEKPLKADGCRILANRLWPRGMTKEAVAVEAWAKDLAPSPELRKWYRHDPDRWPDFQKRYLAELKKNDAVNTFLEQYEAEPTITLLYAAQDTEHTHALILQQYLTQQYQHT